MRRSFALSRLNSALNLQFNAASLAAAAAMMPVAVMAQSAATSFNIDAQPLPSALQEFVVTAGVELLYRPELVAGLSTSGLHGSYTTDAALAQLLQGTGLSVRRQDGTLVLEKQAPAKAAAPADPAVQGAVPAATTAASRGALPPASVGDDSVEMAHIIITGTMISRLDYETPLPVTVLNQADIAQRGAMTASELFSYLPQGGAYDFSESSTGPNDARGDAAALNLRGLGSNNTLVLINGRRVVPHPISAGSVPVLTTNVNQIPVGAIDRVEMLRDGASSLYGSDAVAGVVNTILKTDYEGVETSARYGNVTEGNMDETTLNLLGGHNFNGGRTNVMGYIGYYRRAALQENEKSWGQTGDLRERAHSDDTSWDNRSTSTPYAYFSTGTMGSDGTFSSTGSYHMESGDDGMEVVSGSLPREMRYDYTPLYVLVPKTDRYQGLLRLNQKVGESMAAYAELRYYRAESWTSNAAAPISANSDNNIYVPASNYYNPFGTDVLIRNYRPVEMGPRTADVTSDTWQATLDLSGYVGDWQWDVGATGGIGRTSDIGGNMISESRLRAQLALDTPDAFNIFGGPNANSQETLDAVRISTRHQGQTGLALADAKASGTLFELPGGPLQVAVGSEYRYEDFSDSRDPLSNADDVIALSQTVDSSADRTVGSVFSELSIPVVGADNRIPGLYSVDLSLSARTEHFSDFGTATKPKVGISIRPVQSVMLRASYNEGFHAPTLAQLYSGEITRRNTGVEDPYRADVTATAADLGDDSRQVIRGGNADLGPEEAKARSFGIVYEPSFVDGLSMSLDYFLIKQTDVIDTYGEEDQLELDYELRSSGEGSNPDVVRLDPTADDIAAFDAWNAAHPDDYRAPAGAVDYVRDTYINISRRQVAGYDAGVIYRIPRNWLGKFTVKADASYMSKYDQQRDADSDVESYLEYNGTPRVRAVLGLDWTKDRMNAGVLGRYVSHFYDSSAPASNGDEDSYYQVHDWTTWNAYVGYAFMAPSVQSVNLKVGVNNVFDKAPPLADEDQGYESDIHDPRGRFVYAQIEVKI